MHFSGDDRGQHPAPDQVLADADLARGARRGDQAAWEALVRRYQEPVFRLAYLLLGDADEAADTAQETFLRAGRYLHRYDETRPLRPWLLSITANTARNRLRSLSRYWNALQRYFEQEPPRQTNAEAQAAQSWEAQSVWQAVRKLSPADQEVIYLRYFMQQSVEETATASGVAPGTVKSRLHRALGRLREVIARDHPDLKETWDG